MSDKTSVAAEPPVEMRCERCDVALDYRPLYEGSALMCWWCPCCKSNLRTSEMIQADSERRAAERGITVEELREESAKLIDPTPLSDEALALLRQYVEKIEREWTPVCEHDTKKDSGSGGTPARGDASNQPDSATQADVVNAGSPQAGIQPPPQPPKAGAGE